MEAKIGGLAIFDELPVAPRRLFEGSMKLRGCSWCYHGRIVGPLRSFGATLVPPAIGQIMTGPAKIARDSLASKKSVAVSTNLLPGVRLRGSIDYKFIPLCHNGGSE